MTKHKFPKGYKTWTILNKMNEVNGMTYTEIIKLAYELSNGVGSFDKTWNRGYWSGAFVQAGPGGYPWSSKKSSGPMAKYADKGRDGKYRVNGNGLRYIMEYSTQREGKNVMEGVKAKMEMGMYSDILHPTNQTGNKATVCYGNKPSPEEMAMAIRKESQKETSPEVRLRGLQPGDKVAYRKTDTNESGVGIITWMELFSKTIGEKDGLEIKVIGEVIHCTYNVEYDQFEMGSGIEIEIIKI